MKTLTINSKKRCSRAMKFLIALFLTFFSIGQCDAQDNSRDIVRRSNFIFTGTIIKMAASNINVATNVHNAIVRIDEIMDAVAPYDQMSGKEITVLLTSSQNRKAGDKQVFFTTGWYYGRTLGVKETPNKLFVPEKVNALKRIIISERLNIKNDSLREELKKANVVVQGTVVETDIRVEKNPVQESEHDPEFKRAIIEIKDVLKGTMTIKRVEVYYSSSDDVIWHSAPKLTSGQEGVFLLQQRQAPIIYKIQGYTLLDRRDVQPTENLVKIKSFLKN